MTSTAVFIATVSRGCSKSGQPGRGRCGRKRRRHDGRCSLPVALTATLDIRLGISPLNPGHDREDSVDQQLGDLEALDIRHAKAIRLVEGGKRVGDAVYLHEALLATQPAPVQALV